jgi:hypothetical protein
MIALLEEYKVPAEIFALLLLVFVSYRVRVGTGADKWVLPYTGLWYAIAFLLALAVGCYSVLR